MDEQEKKLMEKYGKLPMKKNMLSGMKVSSPSRWCRIYIEL